MKVLIAVFCLASLAPFSLADEEAIALAKSHIANIFQIELQALDKSYAEKVVLMPGHEFLKERYRLAKAGDRAKGLEVERDALLAAMTMAAAGKPKPPADRVDGILKVLKFDALEVEVGDFATDAADPVGTPDGKLHFTIKDGDVLLKVSPPGEDFLLLHLRKIDGKWRVVSEYLD